MFPLLVGLAAVGALVGSAIRRVTGPSKREEAERTKFEKLLMKPHPTLDEAEDGLVLARRYGDRRAQVRFSMLVQKLRKKRTR